MLTNVHLESTTQGIHGTAISVLHQADFPMDQSRQSTSILKLFGAIDKWSFKGACVFPLPPGPTLVRTSIPVPTYSTPIQFIITDDCKYDILS